jgi:hypothetical protein
MYNRLFRIRYLHKVQRLLLPMLMLMGSMIFMYVVQRISRGNYLFKLVRENFQVLMKMYLQPIHPVKM